MNLFYPFHVKIHSYSSRDFNSRDSRDYGPPPRDYSYRDYPSSGSRDDYGSMSRGYRYKRRVTWVLNHDYFLVHNKWLSPSDRDGYGGGREPRGYMDRPSGSYRESYDGYGKTWLHCTVYLKEELYKNGDQSTESYNLQSQDAGALCPIQRKCFRQTN